jgi:hypothetical protein
VKANIWIPSGSPTMVATLGRHVMVWHPHHHHRVNHLIIIIMSIIVIMIMIMMTSSSMRRAREKANPPWSPRWAAM